MPIFSKFSVRLHLSIIMPWFTSIEAVASVCASATVNMFDILEHRILLFYTFILGRITFFNLECAAYDSNYFFLGIFM